MKAIPFRFVLILTAWAMGAVLAAEPNVPALTPEPQTAKWAQAWWMPRHQQKLEEAAQRRGQVDLLFVGDSITHGWETGGKTVWQEFYGRRRAFNSGFSGDRTEQVLWRYQHGELDGLTPKVAVVMIGTNNTGHRQDPPDQTAAGVKAICDLIHEHSPKTKILLLAIFPRGATTDDPLRVLNEKINERLARLADDQTVFFLNINHVFLGADGSLSREIMPDLLHPNERGYHLWAEAMEPTLKRLLEEPAGAAEQP